ncbi:MAG: ChbG/HpnK family deacetylase [Holdemania massiliensis]
MKLLITSDDYGISDGVSCGILKAIREGVLTETGLFTNLPGSSWAACQLIEEFPDFCLGEDFNLVAGQPVTEPHLIPSLVSNTGSFLTSSQHRLLDQTHPEHILYEDAYLEMENQLKKFIEFTGKNPCYLQGHSYGTKATRCAMKDLGQKYHIPLLSKLLQDHQLPSGQQCAPWNIKPFDLVKQLEANPLQTFLTGDLAYLETALKEKGISHIHVHAGFVDEDLFRRSSYTIIRMKELDFLCSCEFKTWLKQTK